MSEPTSVTTEFVRRHYAMGPTAYREDGSIARMPKPEDVAYCERQFDAWLAEHDRQVAERAWDEGYWLGINGHTGPGNPYKIPSERGQS